MKFNIPYDTWLPFQSFHLGIFLGLLFFSIQENHYPLILISIFGIVTATSYLSILFWEEARKDAY